MDFIHEIFFLEKVPNMIFSRKDLAQPKLGFMDAVLASKKVPSRGCSKDINQIVPSHWQLFLRKLIQIFFWNSEFIVYFFLDHGSFKCFFWTEKRELIEYDWIRVLRMWCVIFRSSLFNHGFPSSYGFLRPHSSHFSSCCCFYFCFTDFLSNLRVLLPHKMWNYKYEDLFAWLLKLSCAISYLTIPQIKSAPWHCPKHHHQDSDCLFVFLPFRQKLPWTSSLQR